LVAKRHQFIDLGDNTVLFRERWQGYGQFFDLPSADAWKCNAPAHSDNGRAEAPNKEAHILVGKEGSNRSHTAANTGSESSDIGATGGGTSDAKKEVALVAQVGWRSCVLIDDGLTKRAFGKLYWAIDEWQTLSALVVSLAGWTLSHDDLGNRTKPHPTPA
jgi:hypothetical protein